MHATAPFSIPAIRNFVPEKVKPWIIICFVAIFQLSGGVYLAAISQMVGSTTLMQEDIMMAGYASMVGMALTFTVMFRLKFRFPSKVAFTVCSVMIIACNLACMNTGSLPVLFAACFVAGVFRMWGTFECMSTIQLWLTPVRDMSVFFCCIQLMVHGSIQLTGITTTYVAFLAEWRYMHWLVIGLQLLLLLATTLLFRTFRAMRKLPLYGIDWLGGVLWGITVLSALFVCNYGDYYDWFESVYIRMATVLAVVCLSLNLWRASFIRHPYITIDTICYPVVWKTLLLYLLFDLLLAPSHMIENLYAGAVLGYDSLNMAFLNWAVLAGVVFGVLFTWRTFAVRKWPYKTTAAIAFGAATLYCISFYFTIDYNLPKGALILPLFLRGSACVILGACFLTALTRIPVFPHFAQSLSMQAFVSASLGGAIGGAVIDHILKVFTKQNALVLGSTLDNVNPEASHMPFGKLVGALQQQAMMVSMKEIFGWLSLLGILCLLLFFIHESDLIRPYKAIHPTFKSIRNMIKREYIDNTANN